MAVLNRKMFSRGGFAHRGTGITTGLATPKRGYVDGPGSYQGVGESSLPTGTAGLLELDSNTVNTGPEPAGNVLSAPFKARDFPSSFHLHSN